MTEEHKQLFRQQQEGYAWLRSVETAELRGMTFGDRVAAFDRIMSLAPYLPNATSPDGNDQVSQAWIKIRERNDTNHK